METKTFLGVEVKDAEQGVALVKFAAYDEIDKHDDVTRKGAFPDGQKVLISAFNHGSWQGALPVGKGTLKTGGDAAYAELQFFMDTEAGRETFKTVKAAEELQQWSYGLDVEKASYGEFGGERKQVRFLEEVKVYEISPVLLGAGNSTATIGVKGASRDNLKMTEECALVMTNVKALADRAEEIVKLRKADGKAGLGSETADLLGLVVEQLERVKSALATDAPSESDDDATAEAELLFAQFLSEE